MTEVPPILLSAVICDRVIFDKITGMASLINIVQNINAPTCRDVPVSPVLRHGGPVETGSCHGWPSLARREYPVRYWQLVFFCELTNGHGRARIKVRLVDAQEEDKIIFEQERAVQFKDVKQVLTLALNLQGIVFPRPGEYRFQLFANERLLGERQIVCRKIKMTGGDEQR